MNLTTSKPKNTTKLLMISLRQAIEKFMKVLSSLKTLFVKME